MIKRDLSFLGGLIVAICSIFYVYQIIDLNFMQKCIMNVSVHIPSKQIEDYEAVLSHSKDMSERNLFQCALKANDLLDKSMSVIRERHFDKPEKFSFDPFESPDFSYVRYGCSCENSGAFDFWYSVYGEKLQKFKSWKQETKEYLENFENFKRDFKRKYK